MRILLLASVLFSGCLETTSGADLSEPELVAQKIAPKYGIPPVRVEYRLWDGTRVDMLDTENNYVWEVDWADNGKWAQAIGQSLYYAEVTGRRPGIILVTKEDKDERYIYRCAIVCARVGIKLRVEKYSDLLEYDGKFRRGTIR